MLAKLRNYSLILNLSLLLIIVLVILSISLPAAAKEDRLIDLNLKGVDIRDALRTIAKLAGVNIVLDESVRGEITILLNKLTFDEALNLVVQSKGFDYIYLNETVVVAVPKRIEKLYRPKKVFKYKLKYRKTAVIEAGLTSFYPELSFLAKEDSDYIIFRGNKEMINEISNLIRILDQPYQKNNTNNKKKEYKFINLKGYNLKEMKNNISCVYPTLTVRVNKGLNNLLLYGYKNQIERAVTFIKVALRHKNKRKIQQKSENKPLKNIIYQLNYLDPGEILNIINSMFPEEKIIANNSKRQLLIRGENKRVNEIVKVIRKMDAPQKQVILEARIEEISQTELIDLGISPENLNKINILNKTGDGLQISWSEVLQALKDKGKAKTLANPRLMALSGEEATLLIGDQIPVKLEKIEDDKVIKEIKYIEAGISLKFAPWVTDNDEIIIEINPSVSSIGETIGESLPAINTREVKTKVILKDDETFVIGGLIQDDIIETISSIPFLSELPILGKIFTRKKINNIKTEVLIFITPKIVKEEKAENNYKRNAGYYQSDIEQIKKRYEKINQILQKSLKISY